MRRLGALGGRLVGGAGSLRGGGTDEAWGCLGRETCSTRGLLGGGGGTAVQAPRCEDTAVWELRPEMPFGGWA